MPKRLTYAGAVVTYSQFHRTDLSRREAVRAAQLASQRGGCAVCGTTSDPHRFVADHCHASGRLRGLLCIGCNTAMAAIDRGEEWLARALAYRDFGVWSGEAAVA